MKVIKKQITETVIHYEFLCPACNVRHTVNNEWEFQGDLEHPSFRPSILEQGTKKDEGGKPVSYRCHSWVSRGKIKFFTDCSHHLAGQKWFELPDIE